MTCHNMTGDGKVMTTSASEMHMRRKGLATRSQSALFMMSINKLKMLMCVVFSWQYSNSATCNSATARHWRH